MSSEENAKFSTESRSFWDETTQLLQNLNQLHHDVANISCPCSKPDCPFSSAKHLRRSHDHLMTQKSRHFSLEDQVLPPRKTIPHRKNGYLSHAANCNVATYFASMRPAYSDVFLKQDCEVTEEPLAGEQDVFERNSPFRKARRRHSSVRVSESFSGTMNSLMVPSYIIKNFTPERSNSLPTGFERPLSKCSKGSSLDSLDSDKMHDIQKSILKVEHHSSSIELVHW